MDAQFQFYEVVKISSDKSDLSDVDGCEGAVLGMTKNNKIWNYAIAIFDLDEECWDIEEQDLLPTGKMMKREDFYKDEEV